MISSFFFYLAIFGIVLLLAKRGEILNDNRKFYWAYIILFLISALRFDIGNDYAGYWSGADLLVDVFKRTESVTEVYNWRDGRYEWGFCILVCLFSWSSYTFFWCNVVYSAILIYTLYYVFKKYNCHYYGLLILVVCEFIFMAWDWIRQSAALSLVLLALTYVHERNKYKFLICIALAYLFHQSSIFLLIAYPLSYVRINKNLVLFALALSLIVFWSGLLDSAISNLVFYFSLVGGYEKYDAYNVALIQHLTIFTRIRTSLVVAIGILVILKMDDEYSFYKNIIAIGLIIFMIGGNSLIFNRIAWYFIIVIFPCFGITMNDRTKKLSIRKLLIYALFVQTIVFSYDILTNTNARGCVPYESVFSEEYENLLFKTRDYK